MDPVVLQTARFSKRLTIRSSEFPIFDATKLPVTTACNGSVRRLTADIGMRKPQLPSGLQSFAQRAIRDVSQPIC